MNKESGSQSPREDATRPNRQIDPPTTTENPPTNTRYSSAPGVYLPELHGPLRKKDVQMNLETDENLSNEDQLMTIIDDATEDSSNQQSTLNHNPSPTRFTPVPDWFSESSEDNNPNSDDTPRPPPITNISTNDGTHRIIIKWKLDKQKGEESGALEQNKQTMEQSILKILQHIFADDDGYFYRWESEDLLQAQVISNMTPTSIRDFVTPAVTFYSFSKSSHLWSTIRFQYQPVAMENLGKDQTLERSKFDGVSFKLQVNQWKVSDRWIHPTQGA